MGIRVSKGMNFNRAEGVLHDAIEGSGEDVAQTAYNEIQQRLRSVLQHPTGHYQSRIQTSTQGDLTKVSDGGVVYGPWLEGTSSRNNRSRFKGYHTFRQVFQKTDQQAGNVAEDAIAEALKKI